MGDGLFIPQGAGKPQRLQGAFVSDDEVTAVVEAVKAQGEPQYTEGVTEEKQSEQKVIDEEIGKDMDDLLEAVELVVTSSSAPRRCCSANSASVLPRLVA